MRKQRQNVIGRMVLRNLFLIPHSSFLILFLLFLSCQTAPHTTETIVFDEIEFLPLDSGAFAYLLADVPHAKPIINNLKLIDMDDNQLQQMLDMTQYAAAAAYLPNSARRYQLSAWGSYPASKAKMALGMGKDWKKYRSSISKAEYWYSAESGLSVAIEPERVFVVAASGNDPDTPPDPFAAAPGTAVPEGFNEFRKGAVLACWLDKPTSIINQKLEEMGIPLEIPSEQILISLFPAATDLAGEQHTDAEQRYKALLRIEVPSAAQARALTTLFGLARGFLAFTNSSDSNADSFAAFAAIFFANPPVQDGKYLTITTNALSAREISLLFTLFSL